MTTLKFTGDLDRILEKLPNVLCNRSYAVSWIIINRCGVGIEMNVAVTAYLN